MLLLIILLPLAAGSELYPGRKEEHRSFSVNTEKQKEILDTINDYRRNVEPTASNMLRMSWSEGAAKTAKNRAGMCVGVSSSEKRVVSGLYCYENTLNSDILIPWKLTIVTWYTNHTDQHYRYGALYPKKFTSSYTRLLLYNVYQVGCAVSLCPASSKPFFYVCHFCPARQAAKPIVMPYKIGPPCGDCLDNCVDDLCTNSCKYADSGWNCGQLKTLFSCNEDTMIQWCQATCQCKTEIV